MYPVLFIRSSSSCFYQCILVLFIHAPVHFISQRQHIIFTTLFIFNPYGQLTYYSSHNADAFSF